MTHLHPSHERHGCRADRFRRGCLLGLGHVRRWRVAGSGRPL